MRAFSASHPGFKLAVCILLLGFVVVAFGAFTRLVDAGLGCPDWPGCYGHLLWPDSPEEVAKANQRWPNMPVVAGRTWPEMIHRYLAAILGLLALVLTLFLRARRRPDWSPPLVAAYTLLGLIAIQALLGMWTVTLKLWPQVVALHLLTGFATLSMLFVITLRLSNVQRWLTLEVLSAAQQYLPWVMLGLGLLIAQIALGGWLSANYAAIACPDLPTCQGRWWPAANFSAGFDFLQGVGPNYLGGKLDNEARVAIHLAHRVMAVVSVAYLTLMCCVIWRSMLGLLFARLLTLILILLAVQFLLGLGNVLLDFPVWVAVAHNLGAAMLLLSVIALFDTLLVMVQRSR